MNSSPIGERAPVQWWAMRTDGGSIDGVAAGSDVVDAKRDKVAATQLGCRWRD
jgi:hypothetical protein